MNALLLILCIATVGFTSIPWKALDTYQEIFWEAKQSAELVIGSVDEMLANRSADSFSFIQTLLSTKMMQARLNETSENSEWPSRFDNVKNNFRKAYNRLEIPLLQRVTEIRQKLSGISSTMVYYKSIADSKFWSCRLSKSDNCTNLVQRWLELKLLSLSCEIDPCESHVVEKREVHWRHLPDDDNHCGVDLYKCSNNECISKSWVCDGEYDCVDHSDEEGCSPVFYHTSKNCSSIFSYLCGNKNCITFSAVCDGKDDCGDKSDELDCHKKVSYSPTNCSLELGTYLCENKKCINHTLVCDGKDDCGDRSDESNCTKNSHYSPTNCSLELGTYLCGNNKCINLSSVCDGTDDCGDGTDEGGNCTGKCLEDCHPRGVCFRTPQSRDCVTACPEGFFETVYGCQRSMEADSSPVSQQVLDLERLISRHSAAYLSLKIRTLSEISFLSFTSNCRLHKSMLDKITKLRDISPNPNSSSTVPNAGSQ
ncbi:very low-density lipoprotein receptor [Halyomorpha halys]|uniref:very low-density lipoprotein receptor n=1 Tax=Halyomorpha halys TaxID=286706 RepID=UPI0006D4EE93|nr:low-density lipoprotein receptor-related protein 2-like [Halyomorpha halys]